MIKICLAIIIFVVLVFAIIYYQNSQIPALGVENSRFKPLSSRPNAVSTQTNQQGKRVATWNAKSDLAKTAEAIIHAIHAYGAAEIIENRSGYIYAIFTTVRMNYHDDVEFWIDQNVGVVHFRSASRAGYSDGGLNRQRYDALSKFYKEFEN